MTSKNRVRVIDFDVAAQLSPLGLCLAKRKITINVLINSIIHVNTDTSAGDRFRPLRRAAQSVRAPFYQGRPIRAWPQLFLD